MNYVLFEDTRALCLRPFTLTHASFEVRCGAYRNIDRIVNLMKAEDSLTLLTRKEIAPVVRERYPEFTVNPKKIDPGLWLNGACLWEPEHLDRMNLWKQYVTTDGYLVGFITDTIQEPGVLPSLDDYHQEGMEIAYLHYLWDAIELNGGWINKDKLGSRFKNYVSPVDFSLIDDLSGSGRNVHPSATLMHNYNIYLADHCEISGGVILDASGGKIIIDSGVKIQIGALIQGPVFIGKDSVVNPGAKIRSHVAIGPVCKVGGEVGDTIIQGYSNKQHDGFIGHSYIGEWVNLGANTNTSDLKNNYGLIRFNFGNEIVDTRRQFLGLFMGDYSKSGISTMFNTGTYAGVGTNIFGGGFQPKYIPSYFWSPDQVTDFEKFLHTCNIMKSRRNQSITEAEKTLLKMVWKESHR